ncbi:MAG TPA: PqiC family protein, partial [Blastocatellia bacterium]|nr:PqiC family protein [Blastocatellia bacterium]
MRPIHFRANLIVFGLCLLATGCTVLAPRPDHSKFFILTPISEGTGSAANAASTPASSLSIGVGPIDFPDYLRRAEVVTRTAPNQIDLAEQRRWAEPLDKGFTRALSENLAHLLNTQKIEKYPWPRNTQIDYQIAVDVQTFETSSDGKSELIARWTIKNGADGKNLYASETTATAPVGPGDTGASA